MSKTIPNETARQIRKAIYILLAIFCLLYVIFALRPLGTELHLSPEWTEDISHVQDTGEEDELIPFRLSQSIGYFTPDGRISAYIPYAAKSSISDSYYATYGTGNESAVMYDNRGEAVCTLKEYGFPYFDEDRVYVFLPGGTSFVRCDAEGNRLWRYDSYSPITAFASSKSGTVVGYADGNLVSFTNDGLISQSMNAGGSRIPVVLGAAISHDGKSVACIYGRNQQRFVLAQKNGIHSTVIFHEYVEKDFNRQVLVKFSLQDSMAFFNYNGGLGLVDIGRLKSSHVPMQGVITQIEESATNGLISVLCRDGDRYTVTIIEPFDHPAAQFSFTGTGAFIQMRGDALFIGHDNRISRLTISRR